MFRRIITLAVLVFGFSFVACASSATYLVQINTSSLAGKTGAIDLNFNPGPLVTQPATALVSGVSTDGKIVGNPNSTGEVSGGLLSSLTFQNTSVLNDYFQAFTFGSKLSFEITLDGPALESPDGTSTSGSTFAFSIFSNQAGTTPALTSDTVNGFGLLVNVNLDSTTTVINNLISGTVTQPLLKTTTSLTASPAGPYVVGETVTIEVSVTAASGSSHPTGTVTLVSPQESVTVALSSSGVLKKTALLNIPAGTYHLYAVYNGDADFKPSTSATVTAIVSKK